MDAASNSRGTCPALLVRCFAVLMLSLWRNLGVKGPFLLLGHNLGPSVDQIELEINGEHVPISVIQPHVKLMASAPPGAGSLSVALTVGNQTAEAQVQYLSPTINAVTPEEIPLDGGEVVVEGQQFGLFADAISVALPEFRMAALPVRVLASSPTPPFAALGANCSPIGGVYRTLTVKSLSTRRLCPRGSSPAPHRAWRCEWRASAAPQRKAFRTRTQREGRRCSRRASAQCSASASSCRQDACRRPQRQRRRGRGRL